MTTMTDDKKREKSAEQAAVDQLVDAGLLDEGHGASSCEGCVNPVAVDP